MSIEEIPADKKVVMTDDWYRAFVAAGCNPICHYCCKDIQPGSLFHLATAETTTRGQSQSGINVYASTESREVMLCADHTAEMLNKQTAYRKRKYREFREAGGGCYRINGKIVH